MCQSDPEHDTKAELQCDHQSDCREKDPGYCNRVLLCNNKRSVSVCANVLMRNAFFGAF